MFRCGSPGRSLPWRGFPIRRPWDQSPVIDSPRLIADSYVLLRLLMPRHPPCALKNLTTKDQNANFRENHENHPDTTTTTPKGHSNRRPDRSRFIYSWKLLLIKDARVHYVVLKQQPQTTHPTHNPKRSTMRSMQPGNQKQTNPTKHTTTQKAAAHPTGPVASGPNSVPNTKPPTPNPHRSRTPSRGHPY